MIKNGKKICGILLILLAFVSICAAYTPNPNEWEYVASDSKGNCLYVSKNESTIKANKNTLIIMTLALTPNSNGSYFIDEVIRNAHINNKYVGGAVHHCAVWNFLNGPQKSHMLTENFVDSNPDGKQIYYSITDPWFKAEYDYAFQRADELGLKYD